MMKSMLIRVASSYLRWLQNILFIPNICIEFLWVPLALKLQPSKMNPSSKINQSFEEIEVRRSA
jgi:hypothetical protein